MKEHQKEDETLERRRNIRKKMKHYKEDETLQRRRIKIQRRRIKIQR